MPIDICPSIMTDIQSCRTMSDKTKPIDVIDAIDVHCFICINNCNFRNFIRFDHGQPFWQWSTMVRTMTLSWCLMVDPELTW